MSCSLGTCPMDLWTNIYFSGTTIQNVFSVTIKIKRTCSHYIPSLADFASVSVQQYQPVPSIFFYIQRIYSHGLVTIVPCTALPWCWYHRGFGRTAPFIILVRRYRYYKVGAVNKTAFFRRYRISNTIQIHQRWSPRAFTIFYTTFTGWLSHHDKQVYQKFPPK